LRPEPVCYWSTTLPPARSDPEPPPPLPPRADVAIVGSGYTGLSAALHLRRAGASVAVLEKETMGWGASSRNGGQVLTGLKLGPADLLRRFGRTRARELFACSLAAIDLVERLIGEEHLACGYRRSGHLQAAAKPSHYDSLCRERDLLAAEFDHAVTVVPRSAQSGELGSDGYHGLLLDERSAALNPAQYVSGLAAAAARAGAQIFERTSVTNISRDRTTLRLTTSAGMLEARAVLVATNGYTDASAPWLRRRVIPIGSFIIATEPLSQELADRLVPKRRVVIDTRHFLHYFRLSDDGRVVFGGRAQFAPSTPGSTRTSARILARDLRRVFPYLAGTRVDFIWSGHVCFTTDFLPRLGEHGGVHYALGYAGHGVAMATYLGRLAAESMLGRTIVNPFRDLAFRAIPFYNGTPWFLPLLGAYYKVRDALE
jgi:glycine/D-amino acid oxidase-like deaminating enzyme